MLTQEEIRKARMEIGLDPETAQPVKKRTVSTSANSATSTDKPLSAEERIRLLRGETPKKEGLLRTLAKDLATPFARAGVSAYNIAAAGGDLLNAALAPKGSRQQFIDKAGENITKVRNVPGLGPLSAVGSQGGTVEGIKDILGTGLEIGSTIVGGGEAKALGNAGKMGLRTVLKQGAKQGIRYGAYTGGAYSAGNALEQNKGLGDVLLDTAAGTIGGGILGAGVGAVTPLAGRAVSRLRKPAQDVIEGTVVSTGKEAAQNASKVAQEAAQSAKPGLPSRVARKVVEPFTEGDGYTGRTARRVVQSLDERAQTKALQPVEQEAVKVGFQQPDIEFIKTASNADKKVFEKMVNVDEAGRLARRAGERPNHVVGETIIKRVKALEAENQKAGEAIRKAVDAFPEGTMDFTPQYDEFVNGLKKNGIEIKADGSLDFRNSRIAGSTGSKDRELLQTMYSDLRPNREGKVLRDPRRVYRIRQKFFDELNLAKANDNIGSAEGLLRDTYSKLAEPLDKIGEEMSTDYAKYRTQYAKTRAALDDFHTLMGKKWTGKLDESANLRAGEILARMKGNASASMTKTLDDIDALIKELGLDDGMSVRDQVEFADLLEQVFGTTQGKSLRGQVGRGVADALDTVNNTAGGKIVGLAKKGYEVLNKVTPEEQRRVLRLLLKAKKAT